MLLPQARAEFLDDGCAYPQNLGIILLAGIRNRRTYGSQLVVPISEALIPARIINIMLNE